MEAVLVAFAMRIVRRVVRRPGRSVPRRGCERGRLDVGVELARDAALGEHLVEQSDDDLFLLPGDTPEREHTLAWGELITGVEVPSSAVARRSHYLKVRDRESYEFAAASAAVGLELSDGVVRAARVALGGVATRPWREKPVEAALIGRPAGEQVFREAAALAAGGARPRELNAYKIELARRTVARALATAGGL